GRLSLQFMRLSGAPQSALYGFQYGTRFSFFQSGIAVEGERMSAGSVLIASAMQHASDNGIMEFDFLRGDEPYKARWSTGFRENKSLEVCRTGAGGSAYMLYRKAKVAASTFAKRLGVTKFTLSGQGKGG